MKPETAKNALIFLSRLETIKAIEVGAFQEVVAALNTFAGETLTMPAPETEETTTGTTSPDHEESN